jgi:hypothetical protein
MGNAIVLVAHLLARLAILLGLGGIRTIVAENISNTYSQPQVSPEVRRSCATDDALKSLGQKTTPAPGTWAILEPKQAILTPPRPNGRGGGLLIRRYTRNETPTNARLSARV